MKDYIKEFEQYLIDIKHVSDNTMAGYRQDICKYIAYLEKQQMPE